MTEIRKDSIVWLKEGKKIKCPHCKNTFAVQNIEQTFIRNAAFIVLNRTKHENYIKCKNCKTIVKFFS